MSKAYEVRCFWDADARVWWAESDDVPGLALEADTMEKLVDEIRAAVPVLLELNCHIEPSPVPLSITASRSEEIVFSEP